MVTIGSSSLVLFLFFVVFVQITYTALHRFSRLLCTFFSKIIEEGCVWYNKKHRFPNLYKYIYVYVYILHICFNNLGSIAQKRKYNSVSTMPREDDWNLLIALYPKISNMSRAKYPRWGYRSLLTFRNFSVTEKISSHLISNSSLA